MFNAKVLNKAFYPQAKILKKEYGAANLKDAPYFCTLDNTNNGFEKDRDIIIEA